MIHLSDVRSDLFLRLGQMNFTLKVTYKLFWATLSPLCISVFTRKHGAAYSRKKAAIWGGFGLTEGCWHSGGKLIFKKEWQSCLSGGEKNNLQNRTVTPACLQSADSSSFMALVYDFPWSFKVLTPISCLDTNDLTQELPLWKRELHSVSIFLYWLMSG